MRRLALMATLAAACLATTGCFRDTLRNCSLFRGDACGSEPGICDWNWFGARDRYQPIVSGYGSCSGSCSGGSCVGSYGCDGGYAGYESVGCEGGYTAYSPGMEVVDGGVYYEGMDGLDGSFADGQVLGGALIPGGYDGEIISGSTSGSVVLPGPAN